MPIVPDYVLSLDRARLAEYFLLFSRFEFALKASGFAKAGRWGAEVDWEKYAQEVGPKLLPDPKDELASSISYLEAEPPKQQVFENGTLNWKPRPSPKTYSRMRSLIFYLQGVRNNLVHGAKFLAKESIDPQRDEKLLSAAECIIASCLSRSPDVYRAFDSEVIP